MDNESIKEAPKSLQNRSNWFKRTRTDNSTNKNQQNKESERQDPKKRFLDFKQKVNDIPMTSLEEFGNKFLSALSRENEILQAAFFIREQEGDNIYLQYACGYACNKELSEELIFQPGEGLPGQVFNDKELLKLTNFPEGYVTIKTALGEASPKSLLLFPIEAQNNCIGVIELASFREFSESDESFYKEVSEKIVSEKITELIKKEI